jgi:glutaredoxin
MIRLLSRLVRARPQANSLSVTVYSRRDCCCCHKALDVLKQFQRRYHLAINEVDIDSDPELAARHGTSVPVVAIDGTVRFRGVVNPVLLERLLSAETREG